VTKTLQLQIEIQQFFVVKRQRLGKQTLKIKKLLKLFLTYLLITLSVA